jgi:hypothetical protein
VRPIPLFHFLNTQTKCTYIIHNIIAVFSLNKPYTLEGFEPWPSVTEAEAMSTAPRSQARPIFPKLVDNFIP